jgi:SAM-dependent methyltransferase
VGREQVLAKVDKAIGHRPDGWARSLEIGAGTGYFTLNLLREGLIGEATCTDISPGMLATLRANAQRLSLDVQTERVDAERLPFADHSFDLVLGHAVLHHIPDLHRAFSEFQRVLAPGGSVLFAGEPSRYGDRLARVPKRAAGALAGEELLANWFGWTNRTLEATAEPADVPWAWRQYAYRGYLALQNLDRRLLESRLPPAIFYNLLISARKPREL